LDRRAASDDKPCTRDGLQVVASMMVNDVSLLVLSILSFAFTALTKTPVQLLLAQSHLRLLAYCYDHDIIIIIYSPYYIIM
jgi:hypothetical protein